MELFRHLVGSEGNKILSASTGKKETLDGLTGILAAYYMSIQTATHFRMQVLNMRQGPMSISAYVQELVERGRKADFGLKEDGILRDLFIHGINDDKIHLELLNHVPAILEEAI